MSLDWIWQFSLEKAGGKTWRKFKCLLCFKKIRNEIKFSGFKAVFSFQINLVFFQGEKHNKITLAEGYAPAQNIFPFCSARKCESCAWAAV